MKNVPILILHGWNLSSTNFGALQKELINKGFKVYCIDLPGFGATKELKISYQLSDYVEFIKRFLEKNKLSKIILIGHSFGGRISIKLAAENPELVHALILTGAPGINPVQKSKILLFLFFARVGKLLFSIPIISILQDFARKLLYKAARATDFYNTNENMRETFKNIIREDLVTFMEIISTPTLLIWGKGDGIVPLGIAKKMNAIIKNSKLVIIDGARHGVPWTDPKEFAGKVEDFLKRLD